MKKIVFLLFMIIATTQLFSDNIKEYKAELVKFFDKTDHSKASIGYALDITIGFECAPSCFTITDDYFIYVCDGCNNRIAYYDLNFKYIGEIKSKIAIDTDSIKKYNDHLYLMEDGNRITKIDTTGEIVYFTYGTLIGSKVFNYDNFYPIADSVFFYDYNNNLRIINEKGEILENTVAKLRFIQIKEQENLKKGIDNPYFNDIEKYIEDNGQLIINNKLYHNSFTEHEEYYLFKKQLVQKKSSETEPAADIKTLKLKPIFFIGYDKENNSYWEGSKKKIAPCEKDPYDNIIIVIDEFGNVRDYFKFDRNIIHVNVSPAGDVYYMIAGTEIAGKMGVAFYKISRRW